MWYLSTNILHYFILETENVKVVQSNTASNTEDTNISALGGITASQ